MALRSPRCMNHIFCRATIQYHRIRPTARAAGLAGAKVFPPPCGTATGRLQTLPHHVAWALCKCSHSSRIMQRDTKSRVFGLEEMASLDLRRGKSVRAAADPRAIGVHAWDHEPVKSWKAETKGALTLFRPRDHRLHESKSTSGPDFPLWWNITMTLRIKD